MRPDGLILLAEKRIGIEAVGMQCARVGILYSLPRHRMVIANWNLRQDVVCLDWYENVVGRCVVVNCCGGRAITEGGE